LLVARATKRSAFKEPTVAANTTNRYKNLPVTKYDKGSCIYLSSLIHFPSFPAVVGRLVSKHEAQLLNEDKNAHFLQPCQQVISHTHFSCTFPDIFNG